jgi:hypothetical protein
MRVIVASGALSAALALAMARFQLLLAADVLALGAALGGLAAFVAAAVSTIRRAGKLPSRSRPL